MGLLCETASFIYEKNESYRICKLLSKLIFLLTFLREMKDYDDFVILKVMFNPAS